jgi:hypothetical protein
VQTRTFHLLSGKEAEIDLSNDYNTKYIAPVSFGNPP